MLDGRQAGLGQDAGHAVAMQVELGGDGADRPAFGVVETQDLRFGFRGNGHACSGQKGVGESDSAGSPGVPSLVTGDGIGSNASGPEWPAPSVQIGVEQLGPRVGNPDASLLGVSPGNDAGARRGHDDPAGWLDSGNRRHGQRCVEPASHTLGCSSVGRDRSRCK